MTEAAHRLSNNPPDPIAELAARLEQSNAPLLKRKEDLAAAAGRMPEISDDETAGKASDFIKLISAALKTSEAARTEAKEPHLAAGRTVDTFFKNRVSDPLTTLKRDVESKLTTYLQRKEAERRRAADEEARRIREKAAAEARAAQQAATQGDVRAAATALDAAATMSQQAQSVAAKAQAATPAELSRTRGEVGSVASLRQTWVGEVEDRETLDLEALRPYLAMDALRTAVGGFVRAGGRELKGARIYQQTTAAVR